MRKILLKLQIGYYGLELTLDFSNEKPRLCKIVSIKITR